jgi:phosphoribosylpyrophosphate synthetase
VVAQGRDAVVVDDLIDTAELLQDTVKVLKAAGARR